MARKPPRGRKVQTQGTTWTALAKRLGVKSELEARFCVAYATHFNGARAVRKAGYAASTGDSQSRQASTLLRQTRIRKAIDRINEDRMEELRIEHASVIGELAKLAFANVADFLEEDGSERRIDLDGLEREDFAAVKEIVVDQVGGQDGIVSRTTLKLSDKVKALELLGKHLKMFTEQHELVTPGGTTIQVVTGVPGAPGSIQKDDDA